MKRLTQIRGGRPCVVLQQNTIDTWMLTKGQWKGRKAQFLYGEHAKFISDVQDILGDDYDIDRLRELVEADRNGRCVVLPDGDYNEKDGENALKSAMNTCFYHNNPVTRYIADAVAEKLTREEAALKGDQNG